MKNSEPRIRRRGRIVYMTDNDAAAFGDLLKQSFPEIEFGVMYLEEKILARFPTLIDAVRYSRTKRTEHWFYGWIPPQRWRPRWQHRYKGNPHFRGRQPNVFVVANLPARWFMFDRPAGFYRPDDLPAFLLGPQGMVQAHYDPSSVEIRRFVDKVFRLLAKVTANRFLRVVAETHEVVGKIESGMYWAGEDALATCRKRLNHYIAADGFDTKRRWVLLKPYDWSPGQAVTE
jgi:hypothetical protein